MSNLSSFVYAVSAAIGREEICPACTHTLWMDFPMRQYTLCHGSVTVEQAFDLMFAIALEMQKIQGNVGRFLFWIIT